MRKYLPCPTPAGFTLLELMVVMLILALLATIAAPQVTRYLGRAKRDTAGIQVEALAAAVEYFYMDLGRYPTTEEGLVSLLQPPSGEEQWNGPYLKKKDSLKDPWGVPYLYTTPGGDRRPFDIYTLGQDKKPGGEGDARDVGNW